MATQEFPAVDSSVPVWPFLESLDPTRCYSGRAYRLVCYFFNLIDARHKKMLSRKYLPLTFFFYLRTHPRAMLAEPTSGLTSASKVMCGHYTRGPSPPLLQFAEMNSIMHPALQPGSYVYIYSDIAKSYLLQLLCNSEFLMCPCRCHIYVFCVLSKLNVVIDSLYPVRSKFISWCSVIPKGIIMTLKLQPGVNLYDR